MIWTPEKEVNPKTRGISSWPTRRIIAYRLSEVRKVADALERVIPELEHAAELIVDRVRRGGRLITIGAGGSGVAGMSVVRELPQNHRDAKPEQFIYRVAGGARIFEPFGCEELEDDRDEGRKDIDELGINPRDVVICISATGRTPYTRGAASAAREAGAYTIGIICEDGTELKDEVHLPIVLKLGPEMFQGATCEKAASAQKDALDAIMDVVVVRLGFTDDNLCRARLVHEKARIREEFFSRVAP